MLSWTSLHGRPVDRCKIAHTIEISLKIGPKLVKYWNNPCDVCGGECKRHTRWKVHIVSHCNWVFAIVAQWAN